MLAGAEALGEVVVAMRNRSRTRNTNRPPPSIKRPPGSPPFGQDNHWRPQSNNTLGTACLERAKFRFLAGEQLPEC